MNFQRTVIFSHQECQRCSGYNNCFRYLLSTRIRNDHERTQQICIIFSFNKNLRPVLRCLYTGYKRLNTWPTPFSWYLFIRKVVLSFYEFLVKKQPQIPDPETGSWSIRCSLVVCLPNGRRQDHKLSKEKVRCYRLNWVLYFPKAGAVYRVGFTAAK